MQSYENASVQVSAYASKYVWKYTNRKFCMYRVLCKICNASTAWSYDFPEVFNSHYAGWNVASGIYFYLKELSCIHLKHIPIITHVCTSLILLDFATVHNTVLVYFCFIKANKWMVSTHFILFCKLYLYCSSQLSSIGNINISMNKLKI